MILGVAIRWIERKTFFEFVRLARKLEPDRHAVVLAGLTKNQIKWLPEGVAALERISSPKKLSAIYTAGGVFFDLTCKDNFPTVNFETETCVTSVVSYDTSGYSEGLTSGCAEAVDKLKGVLVLVKKLAMEDRLFHVDSLFGKNAHKLSGWRTA